MLSDCQLWTNRSTTDQLVVPPRRVFAITIRMHVLFILGAVVILSQALADGSEAGLTGLMVLCVLGTYAILFGIVLLHEFGHCWGRGAAVVRRMRS